MSGLPGALRTRTVERVATLSFRRSDEESTRTRLNDGGDVNPKPESESIGATRVNRA